MKTDYWPTLCELVMMVYMILLVYVEILYMYDHQ